MSEPSRSLVVHYRARRYGDLPWRLVMCGTVPGIFQESGRITTRKASVTCLRCIDYMERYE